MKNRFFILVAGSILFQSAFCQNDTAILNQTLASDTTAIRALALYPANVRNMILEACAQPDALVRIEAMQKNTRDAFKKEVSGLPRDEQQGIWDLARYPGLIDSLGSGKKKSKEEINSLLKHYPSEIHETALKYGRSKYEILSAIHALNQKTNSDFESLVGGYPKQSQPALREIINYPEVISILSANMHTTVSVGDLYKRNPGLVRQKLDSLNFALARQNASDLAEWKKGLEENPQARQEFESSAREYAKKQGYTDADLSTTDTKVVVNYTCHPYPYWYSYPWWWDYPHWYPYPYWYDWGFYYGPYGMVFVGFPSWYFMHWYFYHPAHHYHYSHFSDYCVGHYYGHRGSVNSVNRSVSQWENKNKANLPKNFLAPDSKRADRIKEFGKFEMDYNKNATYVPRSEFLQEHASSYPNISPVLSERPKPTAAPAPREPFEKMPSEPKPYPPVKIQRPEPSARPLPSPPRQIPQPRPSPAPRPMPSPAPRPMPSPAPRPMPAPSPRPAPRSVPSVPHGGGSSGSNAQAPVEPREENVKSGFVEFNEAQSYHRYCWLPER